MGVHRPVLLLGATVKRDHEAYRHGILSVSYGSCARILSAADRRVYSNLPGDTLEVPWSVRGWP